MTRKSTMWCCCMSLLCLTVVLFCTVSGAYGQSAAFATITGRALDPKGASVPDATVTATNTETGISRTTKTTGDGLYRFDALAPGVYDLSVDAPGFTKAEAKAVKLQVGEQRDVNFNLAVAGQKQSVVVTSELPLIETAKTDVSSVIDDKAVKVLPTTTGFTLPGGTTAGAANDYSGLALLAPGVRYDFSNISNDLIGPGAVNDRGIQVNLDGGDISDQLVSTRDALGASLDEVKEFQVLTNGYNAEYGQSGGVVLNVITKSGTNQIHGEGHGFFRGRNLTASTFFYNLSSDAQTRRAPFHKHEGGFTLGGPFVKDRTFWFVSYEATRQGVPLTLNPPSGTVTTAQPTNEILWSAKLDHKLSDKHQFTARVNVQRDLSDNLLVQIAPIATPESLVAQVIHDLTTNVGLVSSPTLHTVNEARFFWHRFLSQTPVKSSLPGQQGPNFYHGAAFCCPQGALQNRYQYMDNLSWTHGAHTIKTGVNISHYPYFSLFTQINKGLYIFDNPQLPGQPVPAPPSEFDIGLGPAKVTSGDNLYGFYVQDTWRVRPTLTLNYGLRYDLESGAFTGGTVVKSDLPGHGCFQANGIIPACSSDHNNVQPRVGLAWSPAFDSGILHKVFGGPSKSVVRASFAEVSQMAYLNIVLDSLNFDGVNLVTVSSTNPCTNGQQPLCFFPNRPPDNVLQTLLPVGFFGRVRPISNDLRNAESRQVSLSVSRQFTNTVVAEVGYIGVFGFGLFGERDRNYPQIVQDTRAGIPSGFFYLASRPDSRFTAVRTNDNSRTSAYHGGYLKLTKRLSHHFQLLGGYTYSKTLSTTEDFFGLSEPGDPRNIRADRAVAQNDLRHQGNFGLVIDTAKLTGEGFLGHIVNNWNLGFVGQLQSGRAYPISTGDFPFSGASFFGAGNETQQRPNVLADGTIIATNVAARGGTNLAISQNGVAQCQAAGFASCPKQTTFLAPPAASASGPKDSFTGDIVDFQFLNGNLQRNAALGDPYYRFDISFLKAFPMPWREGMSLEFKVDIFNVFNRPNFVLSNGNDDVDALPIPTPLNSDGTKNTAFANAANCRSCINPFTGFYIGADGRPLTIQTLRRGRVDRDLGNPNWGRIGDPTATDIARTLQLAVRFRF